MRKRRGHVQTQLWDLFHPRPQTPMWEELPGPMKRQLTELLARMLREQLQERRALRGDHKEADHE